jgi:hypothetical protein
MTNDDLVTVTRTEAEEICAVVYGLMTTDADSFLKRADDLLTMLRERMKESSEVAK